jgi:hypothetical protein
MLKKIISLSLALALIGLFAACAPKGPKTEVIAGTITKAALAKAGNRMEVLLNLEGRSETFLVYLSDTHRFGMTTIERISSELGLIKFLQDLEQTKGWQVKLTCEKLKTQKGPEYLVKTFEKLAGK